MALTPGTRLGPYEIAAQIGVGGMGEVYQATDTNLARQVAIKVLPASVASDPERLARFDREAKTLMSAGQGRITGPNIVIVPIAFVCEHSETLVELDIDYAELAQATGVPKYHRVPTAGTDVDFINGLARLVGSALAGAGPIVSERGGRVCPAMFGDCPMTADGASA